MYVRTRNQVRLKPEQPKTQELDIAISGPAQTLMVINTEITGSKIVQILVMADKDISLPKFLMIPSTQ